VLAFAAGRWTTPARVQDRIVATEIEASNDWRGYAATFTRTSSASSYTRTVTKWLPGPAGTAVEQTVDTGAKASASAQRAEAQVETRVEYRDIHVDRTKTVETDPPRWGIHGLVGIGGMGAIESWGLHAVVRVLGPLDAGVWGLVDTHGKLSGGVSVGVAW
jgi:hypothetical protein